MSRFKDQLEKNIFDYRLNEATFSTRRGVAAFSIEGEKIEIANKVNSVTRSVIQFARYQVEFRIVGLNTVQ